jgi:hypothetical protein
MASPPDEKKNKSSPARWSMSWMQLGIAGVLAAVVAGMIHYSLTYQHQSAFEDERAFRVLDEQVTQIRNLETSRATFLDAMPSQIVGLAPFCTDPDPTIRDRDAMPRETYEASYRYYTGYIDHLDFSNTKLCAIVRASAAKDVASPSVGKAADNSAPAAGSAIPGTEAHPSSPAPKTVPDSGPGSALTALATSVCAEHPNSVAFIFSAKDDRLTTVSCGETWLVLQESLERAIRKFISQDFFDESILTFANGTVIGEFPMQSTGASASAIALHKVIADRLNIINAKVALNPPPAPDDPEATRRGSSSTPARTPQHHLEPFAWSTRIAEQQYRVSVLPFNAPYSVAFPGAQESCPKDQDSGKKSPPCDKRDLDHLYIIGLHRIDWSRDILHALWPAGLWAAMLLLSLNLVAWPLISLALGPAEESISVARAFGCLVGLMLIPALLIIAAASLWSQLELESWLRVSAKNYAHSISSQLRNDLLDGGQILSTFRPVFREPSLPPQCDLSAKRNLRPQADTCTVSKGGNYPVLAYADDDAHHQPLYACIASRSQPDADRCEDLLLVPPANHPLQTGLSPFRSIIALNPKGDRFGPALSPFRGVSVNPGAQVSDREYFQALKAGQEWVVEAPDSSQSPMVAQRLYNRGDASKALQLAIPLCDRFKAFCGIITGDIRMYGLTSPVSPPLLKFAVIDTATGTVIFSSTDTRSLAENFFRESEQDPTLLAVVRSHYDADFVGRYLGDPQRFYYTPIANVPWGVLVFYSTKELGDLPFRAGSAALVCYAGLLIAAIAALCVLRWFWLLFTAKFPEPRELLKWAWPGKPWPEQYRHLSRFRPAAWAFLVLLIGMLASGSVRATLGTAFAVLGAASLAGLIHRRNASGPSKREPGQQYAQCLMVVVTAASVLPAYGLFVEFYHLQYDALIRDGLAENAAQIQSRHDAVQEELRRLLPPGSGEQSGQARSTQAWRVALQPNIGMKDLNDDQPVAMEIIDRDVKATVIHPQLPNLHQRLVWQWTVSSQDQLRRFAMTTGPASGREPEDAQCGLDDKGQAICQMRMSDGRPLRFLSKTTLDFKYDENGFDWWWLRALGICACVLLAAMGTSFLCWLVTTRLVGVTPALERLWNVQRDPALAGMAFANQWRTLAPAQRLALYQLARDEIINPRNFAALEKPLSADLIKLDHWPEPRTDDLKERILHAERESDFKDWQRAAGNSPWRTIRGPLFIVLMVVIAWLSWAAGGSMKALLAILVATGAFLGQIVQLVNFARGGGTSSKGS